MARNLSKITIGCIYNSVHEYERMIKSIVNMERELDLNKIEFIGVYNSGNTLFNSPRKAIKWIMNNSHSNYILMIHQDVEFIISENPISNLLNYFNSLANAGIIGVAGVNSRRESCGLIVDFNQIFGDLFFVPKSVDGIDELLFGFDKEKFKDFDFIDSTKWHGYATEMCMYAKVIGLTNYVVPIVVHHKSPGKNRRGLYEIHKELEKRYPSVLPFYTTVGFLGKDDSVDLKTIIKNKIQKQSLSLFYMYSKLSIKLVGYIIKLIPSLQKSKIIEKISSALIPLSINKLLLPVLFIHVRKALDNKNDFDPIFIPTNSISNVINDIETHHLYLYYNKFEAVDDFVRQYKQIIIENYNFIPYKDFSKISSLYKIKFKSEKYFLGVKNDA